MCVHRNSQCVSNIYTLFLITLQASRGQSADLIIVDEVGFVSPKVLLSVLPNIAFWGRKQVHITSHVASTPWLNKVADIKTGDGEPAYHVVSQTFKCRSHAHLSSTTCPCVGVYCPSRTSTDSNLRQLMNTVVPMGFESEVTGSASMVVDDKKESFTSPFDPSIINKFLSSNCMPMICLLSQHIVRVIVTMDPTFGGGSKSCVGLCIAVELDGGVLVVRLCIRFNVRDMIT